MRQIAHIVSHFQRLVCVPTMQAKLFPLVIAVGLSGKPFCWFVEYVNALHGAKNGKL